MEDTQRNEENHSAIVGAGVIVVVLIVAAVWMLTKRMNNAEVESDFSDLVENPVDKIPDANVFDDVETNPFQEYANPFE